MSRLRSVRLPSQQISLEPAACELDAMPGVVASESVPRLGAFDEI